MAVFLLRSFEGIDGGGKQHYRAEMHLTGEMGLFLWGICRKAAISGLRDGPETAIYAKTQKTAKYDLFLKSCIAPT